MNHVSDADFMWICGYTLIQSTFWLTSINDDALSINLD